MFWDKFLDEKKSTALHARRPALIVLTLMVLMQIGGINAVLFYLKDIFLKADTGYSPGLQTVIVSIFQVSSTFSSDEISLPKGEMCDEIRCCVYDLG